MNLWPASPAGCLPCKPETRTGLTVLEGVWIEVSFEFDTTINGVLPLSTNDYEWPSKVISASEIQTQRQIPKIQHVGLNYNVNSAYSNRAAVTRQVLFLLSVGRVRSDSNRCLNAAVQAQLVYLCTTSVAIDEWRITYSLTLPISARFTAPTPRDPITMRSAFSSWAMRHIPSPGLLYDSPRNLKCICNRKPSHNQHDKLDHYFSLTPGVGTTADPSPGSGPRGARPQQKSSAPRQK